MLKKFKIVLLLVLVLLPAISHAYTYSSLYQFSQDYSYTDGNGNPAVQSRIGFHDLYNYDDPIVRCHSVNSCSYQSQYYVSVPELIQEIQAFKVYVGPGTNSINLTVMLNQPSYLAVVARWGTALGDYSGYLSGIGAGYYSLPEAGFTMTQLHNGDCIGRSASGIMNVIADGNCSVSTGGWVYILILVKSGSMYSIQYSSTIDTTPFMTWFRNKAWLSNDDPSDYSGTPTPTPTTTPTPTPTPSPTPSGSPTPTPLPGCGNGGPCPSNYHCVNGACVPVSTPTPTPTPGTNCGNSGPCPANWRCVNGECTPVWPSTTPTPTPGANCGSHGPCPYGYTCSNGVCVSLSTPTPTPTPGTGCGGLGPCPANYHCVNGVCVPIISAIENDYSQGFLCGLFGGRF